jgi:phage protein D
MVNGAPVASDVLSTIQQLQVEDHAKMADMLRLRVLPAQKPDGSGWTVLDDDVFPRLTNVQVQIKIGAAAAIPLIDAYVIENRVEFSNTPGTSYLDVVAMDGTVLLSLDEKVRSWPNMTHSDIASVIFGEYGFATDIEDTSISYSEDNTTNLQHGTDMQFLLGLAKRNGFECFVEADPQTGKSVGHFHKPRVAEKSQGVLSVNLGQSTNVNVFHAKYDMLRPIQAQATNLDIGSQDSQDAQADRSSLKSQGQDPAVDPNRPRKVLVTQTGLTKADELQHYTQALVDEASFAIVAHGELNTVAYGSILKAKQAVSVRGAGRQFSGDYYIMKVLHIFTGEGYTQKFSMRRNALGVPGQESFAEDNALPN